MALRAGKFKVPIGLELLQTDPYRELLESSFATALVPNRDVGVQLLVGWKSTSRRRRPC